MNPGSFAYEVKPIAPGERPSLLARWRFEIRDTTQVTYAPYGWPEATWNPVVRFGFAMTRRAAYRKAYFALHELVHEGYRQKASEGGDGEELMRLRGMPPQEAS